MSAIYIPERGDVIWADLSPTIGHEQSGRRPLIVLSPRDYNRISGLVVGCPITRQSKRYLFELPLPVTAPVKGVVLCDQVKSIDWRGRNVDYLATVADVIVRAVSLKIAKLLGFKIA